MEKEKIEEVVETVTEAIVENPPVETLDIPTVPVVPAEIVENSEGLNFKLIAALTGGAAALTAVGVGIRKLIKKRKAKKEEDAWEEIDLSKMDNKDLEEYLEEINMALQEIEAEVARREAADSEEEKEETPKKEKKK